MSIVRDLSPLFGATVWFQLQLEIKISLLLTGAIPNSKLQIITGKTLSI